MLVTKDNPEIILDSGKTDIKIWTSEKEYRSGDTIYLNYRISNNTQDKIYLNKPGDNIFLLLVKDGVISVIQYFEEEILKDKKKNIYAKKGGFPEYFTLESMNHKNGTFEVDIPENISGTFEIEYSLGFNTRPRSDFLVDGAKYEYTILIDKFLEWQKKIISNKIEVQIIRHIEASGEDFKDDENSKYIALADSLYNLAKNALLKKEFKEAERLLIQSMEINRKIYGDNHPKIASIIYNLGIVFFYAGKKNEAEIYLKRAISINEKTLGKNNIQYIDSRVNLAKLYITNNKKNEGIKIIEEEFNYLSNMDTISVELQKYRIYLKELMKRPVKKEK